MTYTDADIYKYNKDDYQNLHEPLDKVECVERAKAYIQNISKFHAETQEAWNEVRTLLQYFPRPRGFYDIDW